MYLKGEMSIVGARPLMEESFRLYSPEVQKIIYNSRPGITGIGSLIFRDEENMISSVDDLVEMYGRIFAYKGELEVWYQKHASMYTDFMIIFLTVWVIFSPNKKLIYKIFPDLPSSSNINIFSYKEK